jgi:predicted O-methyltransferase YrrM
MYSSFQFGVKYIQYYFRALNSKGHGIHSPFVFNLVTKVLNDETKYEDYKRIEQLRAKLLDNNHVIEVEDFGAGSAKGFLKQRSIQQIASSSLKKPKYAQLIYRLVKYFQPQTIVELGTSLGITTSYLAAAKPEAAVITMEGAASVAAVAQQNFQQLGLENIKTVVGNFDETLMPTLSGLSSDLDFIFIDGNHRKVPTLQYFHQLLGKSNANTVFVFDDIHWSKEMEEAWEEIKLHQSVTVTIDVFFIGLVFLRKEQLEKEHFIIRF